MASMAMQMTKKLMKEQYAIQGTNREDGIIDPLVMRKASDASMMLLKPEEGVTFTELKLGILDAEACIPENKNDGVIVMYIHGGGLVAGNTKTSRYYASFVAHATGWTVYSCSYRLAPENTLKDMLEDCVSGYAALLRRYPATPIVLIGDSGGAYLCVTTALTAKERGLRLPNAVALNSVIIDWSGALNKERLLNTKSDVALTVRAIEGLADLIVPGGENRCDWHISPLYGDFGGFPPLFLSWCSGEILAADSLKLAELVIAAGGIVERWECPDAFHGFQTMGHILPESEEVLKEAVAFITAHI